MLDPSFSFSGRFVVAVLHSPVFSTIVSSYRLRSFLSHRPAPGKIISSAKNSEGIVRVFVLPVFLRPDVSAIVAIYYISNHS